MSHQTVELLMNEKFDGMPKEVIMAYFKTLSWLLPKYQKNISLRFQPAISQITTKPCHFKKYFIIL